MIKSRLTLFFLCLTLICAASTSWADKEFFQKIEEKLGMIQNQKNYIENQLAQLEEAARQASEGAGNVTKKINEIEQNPLGIDEELLNSIPSEIPDLNNIGKATDQVESGYNAQLGQARDERDDARHPQQYGHEVGEVGQKRDDGRAFLAGFDQILAIALLTCRRLRGREASGADAEHGERLVDRRCSDCLDKIAGFVSGLVRTSGL